MDDQTVYPDIIDRVIAGCRTTFGDRFNAYYEGDPGDIPKSNLPCIIVEVQTSDISIENAPTSFDGFTDRISIRLVLDYEDDIGKSDDTDLTARRLRRMVQARDAVTGKYADGTLLHAVRNDLTFAEFAYNTDVQITYGINPRTEMVTTSEAQVVLLARGKILRV